MKIISHRGNLNGPEIESENRVRRIDEVIGRGFDVEIDLWKTEQGLFLGHDSPLFEVSTGWLIANRGRLWAHCKNIESAVFCCSLGLNWFGHDEDPFVSTSHGYIWVHPRNELGLKLSNAIILDIEGHRLEDYDLEIYGVCSDWPLSLQALGQK